MSASFSTGNWETINSLPRFSLILGLALILAFRNPLSERFKLALFRGHEERVEKKSLLATGRASVSQCLGRQDAFIINKNINPQNGQLPPSSITNEIPFLGLRRHLSPEAIIKLDELHYAQLFEKDWEMYDRIEREKIAVFSKEIDQLAVKWKINV